MAENKNNETTNKANKLSLSKNQQEPDDAPLLSDDPETTEKQQDKEEELVVVTRAQRNGEGEGDEDNRLPPKKN